MHNLSTEKAFWNAAREYKFACEISGFGDSQFEVIHRKTAAKNRR